MYQNSSFIFRKEASILDIKREVNKEMLKRGWIDYSKLLLYRDRHEFKHTYLNNGIKILNSIEVHLKELKDLDHKAICDIFDRYSIDVVKSLLWFHRIEDFYGCISDEKFKQVIYWNYNEQQLHKIFTQVLLSLMTYIGTDPLDWTVPLSYESIQYLIEEFLDNLTIPYYEGSEFINEIFKVHKEAGLEFIKRLNRIPAEIMGEYLDFHYLYYTKESCNNVLAEVLLNLPSCISGFIYMK